MSDSATRAYDLYQLADALRMSHWTLRRHVKLGSIQVTRMGNRIRVSESERDCILRDGLPSLTASTKPHIDPDPRLAESEAA
ncbi:MAG TPA: hypothetical protein VGX94_12045 [Terriglobia bacterium]|nr:hypothetical protein [Terriglobia bacterium]